VLARAEKAGVPARYIAVAGRTKDVYDAEVTAAFTDAGVSLVLLVGYMRILSSQVQALSFTVVSYNLHHVLSQCLVEADLRRSTLTLLCSRWCVCANVIMLIPNLYEFAMHTVAVQLQLPLLTCCNIYTQN
jgi:hypothetical protein